MENIPLTKEGLPDQSCSSEVVVALLDVLGFSDLVTRNALESVSETLGAIVRDVKRNTLQQVAWLGNNFRWLAFSDSILVWAYLPANEKAEYDFLGLVANIVIDSFRKGYPLRGAISHGTLYVNNNGVVIGEPIVEAHKAEGETNWSGVILTDSMVKHLKETGLFSKFVENGRLVEYTVPKKGHVCVTEMDTVLVWWNDLAPAATEVEPAFLKHHAGQQMTWDIKQKIFNTMAFVEAWNIGKYIYPMSDLIEFVVPEEEPGA